MPEMLQIRINKQFSGKIAAGAPEPSRTLTAEEVRSEMHHFTVARRGPRTKPCHTLLLSGFPLEDDELGSAISDRQRYEWRRMTLHLESGQRHALQKSRCFAAIDTVSLRIRSEEDLADLSALRRAGKPVTAVILLDDDGLSSLERWTSSLLQNPTVRLVLSWPFPSESGRLPPPAEQVLPRIRPMVNRLTTSGVQVGIKGLPACVLGEFHPLVWKSANRWYVDADHRGDGALLFFPGVVRFLHPDECRFCAVNHRCDGVVEAWCRSGRAGVLRAIESDTVDG